MDLGFRDSGVGRKAIEKTSVEVGAFYWWMNPPAPSMFFGILISFSQFFVALRKSYEALKYPRSDPLCFMGWAASELPQSQCLFFDIELDDGKKDRTHAYI